MVDEIDKETRKAAARQKRIVAEENRAKAVEFRKMGMSYEAIGKQLGISGQAAHQAVLKAMKGVKVRQDKDANIIKLVEYENLDRLQLAAWPGAMKGNHLLIDKVLKIMERRAKMMGLDAPEKHANTDSQGKDLPIPKRIQDMSHDEIKARLKELRQELGDGGAGE